MATNRRKWMPPRGRIVRWAAPAELAGHGEEVLVWRYGVVVDLWSGRRPAGNYARLMVVAPMWRPPGRKLRKVCLCRRPAWRDAVNVDVTDLTAPQSLLRWREVWAVKGPGGRWHVPRRGDYDFPGVDAWIRKTIRAEEPHEQETTHHRPPDVGSVADQVKNPTGAALMASASVLQDLLGTVPKPVRAQLIHNLATAVLSD